MDTGTDDPKTTRGLPVSNTKYTQVLSPAGLVLPQSASTIIRSRMGTAHSDAPPMHWDQAAHTQAGLPGKKLDLDEGDYWVTSSGFVKATMEVDIGSVEVAHWMELWVVQFVACWVELRLARFRHFAIAFCVALVGFKWWEGPVTRDHSRSVFAGGEHGETLALQILVAEVGEHVPCPNHELLVSQSHHILLHTADD